MTSPRVCLDCRAPVKLRTRVRCHVCHRRSERAALKRPCTNCGQLRHLQPAGWCVNCVRSARPPKPPKTILCRCCGEQRRNVGHGLCNRCALADPDRPFRYAAALATRLQPAPPWWRTLLEFTAARYHPSRTVAVLREIGRLLVIDPSVTPNQLSQLPATALSATTRRAFTAFPNHARLVLATDDAHRRADTRRETYLAGVPAALSKGVAQFNHSQMSEQDRRRRTGRRTLSEITLRTRLRILRDLAVHLCTRREVTGESPRVSWRLG